MKKIGNFRIKTPTSDSTQDFEELKKECKKLFEKSIAKNTEFETAKQNAKDWCASDSEALTKELATTTRGQVSSEPGSSGRPDASRVSTPGNTDPSQSRSSSGDLGVTGGG